MKPISLVTGANRGIGLEISHQLARKGHQVIMAGRNMDKVRIAAEQVMYDAFPLELDVADMVSIQLAAETVEQHFGRIDVLLHNAGIAGSSAGAMDGSFVEKERVIQTNFLGPWQTSQAFLPMLRSSSDGRIIHVSSGMGATESLTAGGSAAYRLSKSSLNALTILMAAELAPFGISVNSVCPGWVRTDMGGASAPGSVEEGADTPVWAATEPNFPTGKFFRARKEIPW
ncbi:SDR family NAD(P)-dependent oxidoreductase [Pontibacter sp. G13]|uniref:SDR family NAD(P)-dependent oxidoreductase n=1 Tax=Pontibacter sp. G13 TaxID=3074898 RepID=UPI00288991D6|nr:SDR family NAD(P)-dependent oxidoreductase [Pontibacter sp. G13]WNJ16134.1 SDR family NAD(P)-dependent oxidoreductase [Pontibacter sp. G13]